MEVKLRTRRLVFGVICLAVTTLTTACSRLNAPPEGGTFIESTGDHAITDEWTMRVAIANNLVIMEIFDQASGESLYTAPEMSAYSRWFAFVSDQPGVPETTTAWFYSGDIGMFAIDEDESGNLTVTKQIAHRRNSLPCVPRAVLTRFSQGIRGRFNECP